MAAPRHRSSLWKRMVNVLMVEDDVCACKKMSAQLIELSECFTFAFAHTLAEALMQLSRRKFEVVLLDLALADSHGLETFVEVHTKAPHIPILILSGGASEAQAVKAVQLGAQDYLDKHRSDSRLIERAIRYAIERTNAERERLQAEKKMLEMQKLESLGLMAAGVAHDFNNLLAIIVGRLQLIQMGSRAPQLNAQLEDIVTTAYRASDLARQMMAYAGKGQIVAARLELNKLLDEMMGLIRSSIGKQVQLLRELSSTVPAITGNATQIRQVIMNLAINASQAIGEKPGEISMRSGTLKADQEFLKNFYLCDIPAGAYVFLSVVDSGCGMDLETKSRIFEPFFTTKFSGRGLGLAAVVGVVRQHKGAIRIESSPGKGSTFTVLFPMDAAPRE